MTFNLDSLSIEDLHRLAHKTKKIELERNETFNRILKAKDAKALDGFLEKYSSDLAFLTPKHFHQNYQVEDIAYIQSLIKAYKNHTNLNSVIHSTLLTDYKLSDYKPEDEDSITILSIEEEEARQEPYGLFQKAFYSIENYKLIKDSFPEEFKKFFLNYQNRWEFWKQMNVPFVSYLIENENLSITESTIKTLSYSNTALLNYFYNQEAYQNLFNADTMRKFLASNLHNIEEYYYNEKTHHLFTPETVEYLFNTAWMGQSAKIMSTCAEVLGANTDKAVNEVIESQENITKLCKSRHEYFSFFMSRITMTHELFSSFYKPLAKNYTRGRDSAANMMSFFDAISNNETFLDAFEKKCYLSKKSNPELWEDMLIVIQHAKLHKKLDTSIDTSVKRSKI